MFPIKKRIQRPRRRRKRVEIYTCKFFCYMTAAQNSPEAGESFFSNFFSRSHNRPECINVVSFYPHTRTRMERKRDRERVKKRETFYFNGLLYKRTGYPIGKRKFQRLESRLPR